MVSANATDEPLSDNLTRSVTPIGVPHERPVASRTCCGDGYQVNPGRSGKSLAAKVNGEEGLLRTGSTTQHEASKDRTVLLPSRPMPRIQTSLFTPCRALRRSVRQLLWSRVPMTHPFASLVKPMRSQRCWYQLHRWSRQLHIQTITTEEVFDYEDGVFIVHAYCHIREDYRTFVSEKFRVGLPSIFLSQARNQSQRFLEELRSTNCWGRGRLFNIPRICAVMRYLMHMWLLIPLHARSSLYRRTCDTI